MDLASAFQGMGLKVIGLLRKRPIRKEGVAATPVPDEGHRDEGVPVAGCMGLPSRKAQCMKAITYSISCTMCTM